MPHLPTPSRLRLSNLYAWAGHERRLVLCLPSLVRASTSASAVGIEDGPDANQHTKLSSEFRNHIFTCETHPSTHLLAYPPPPNLDNKAPLEKAVKEGDLDGVSAAIKAGADVGKKVPSVRLPLRILPTPPISPLQ